MIERVRWESVCLQLKIVSLIPDVQQTTKLRGYKNVPVSQYMACRLGYSGRGIPRRC